MRIDKGDLQYLAGFLEGDGSIGITRKASHNKFFYAGWIDAANTERKILLWLKKKFGGDISFYKARANETRFKGRKKVWVWSLPAYKFRELLPSLVQNLKGFKRQRAKLVLELQILKDKNNRKRYKTLKPQERLWEKCRAYR